MTGRFMFCKEVLEQVPFSRSTLYRMIDKGEFPAQITFGGRAAWVRSEVEGWLNAAVDRPKARPLDRDDDDLIG